MDKAKLKEAKVALDQLLNESFNGSNEDFAEQIESVISSLSKGISQEKAEHYKSSEAFLKTLSHDLRAPLNNLLVYSELLKNSSLDREQVEWVNYLEATGASIQSLFCNIVDLSNARNDNIHLDRVEFNLKQILHQIITDFSFKIGNRDITFDSRMQEDLKYKVKGDPGRIRDILMKAIKEIIQLTLKCNIELICTCQDETEEDIDVHFEIKVTESNNPIDPYKIIQSPALYAAMSFLKYMNGSMDCEKHEDGSISIWFNCRLIKQLSLKKQKLKFLDNIKGMKVLIADQKAIRREMIKKHLRVWHVDYEEAKDEQDAFNKIRDTSNDNRYYNFILVQHSVPGIDGFHLADQIKPFVDEEHSSMIMQTSCGVRGDAAAALQSGYHAYLTSPVSESQLFDCMLNVANMDRSHKDKVLVTKYNL